jgi:hypothetical protein
MMKEHSKPLATSSGWHLSKQPWAIAQGLLVELGHGGQGLVDRVLNVWIAFYQLLLESDLNNPEPHV